jgi:hypothetical protein
MIWTTRRRVEPGRRVARAARARATALGLLCTLSAWIAGAAAAGPIDIEFDPARNMLGVQVHDAALLEVLKLIAAKTGMKLVAHGGNHARVSARFSFLPLEQALKRLLEGYNFAFVGGAPGEPPSVLLLSSGTAPSAPTIVKSRTAQRTVSVSPATPRTAVAAPAQLPPEILQAQRETIERAFGNADELNNLLESLQGQVPDNELVQQIYDTFTPDRLKLPAGTLPGSQ